jgi:hypothetical protein
MTPEQHRAAVETWRRDRNARLRNPDGWLSLVGLYWLEPGEHRLGSDPDCEIQLSGDEVPPLAGTLRVADGVVLLAPATPDLRVGDAPAVAGELLPDVSGSPTTLAIGELRLHVIRRGARVGLRVRDRAAPALTAFRGVDAFPVDPGWRLGASLVPAPAGTTVTVPDITGHAGEVTTPGWVEFDRDGEAWRLTALPDDDGSLFLVFGDATNGTQTYGGGRFLYTDPPSADGSLTLDFNLAYNPPCVFSPYATCPLPPAENRLALSISAGELAYRP